MIAVGKGISSVALQIYRHSPVEPPVFLLSGVVLGQKSVYQKGTKQRLICRIGFSGKPSAMSRFTVLESGLAQIWLALFEHVKSLKQLRMESILEKLEQCCKMHRTGVVRTMIARSFSKMLVIFGRNTAEFPLESYKYLKLNLLRLRKGIQEA